MSQNSLIEVLEANRLLRSLDEVVAFKQALTELAQHPNLDHLVTFIRFSKGLFITSNASCVMFDSSIYLQSLYRDSRDLQELVPVNLPPRVLRFALMGWQLA